MLFFIWIYMFFDWVFLRKEIKKMQIRTDNTETLKNALKRIAELEAQNEKMKCCPNCDFIFRDGNCYYDKECRNKDHWKLRR